MTEEQGLENRSLLVFAVLSHARQMSEPHGAENPGAIKRGSNGPNWRPEPPWNPCLDGKAAHARAQAQMWRRLVNAKGGTHGCCRHELWH